MTNNLPLWIVEDITWPLLWGLLAIGILAVTWFVTRQFKFMIGAICVVLLIVLIAAVEQKIVTEKEYLVDSIYVLADCVRNNDAEGIFRYVRDDNEAFAERIRNNLARYEFRSCSVIGFRQIDVDPPDRSPRKAMLSFTVWASGFEARRLDEFYSSSVAVNLEFQQRDGKWAIESYGYVAPANAQSPITMHRN